MIRNVASFLWSLAYGMFGSDAMEVRQTSIGLLGITGTTGTTLLVVLNYIVCNSDYITMKVLFIMLMLSFFKTLRMTQFTAFVTLVSQMILILQFSLPNFTSRTSSPLLHGHFSTCLGSRPIGLVTSGGYTLGTQSHALGCPLFCFCIRNYKL